MAVYFVKSGSFVKIGFGSKPYRRFFQIRMHNPEDVELLAIIEGDKACEGELHQRFDADRHRGEWFRFSPALRDYLSGLPKPEQPRRAQRHNRLEFFQMDSIDDAMIDRLIRENLIAIAKAYGRAERISITTVSKRAYGQSKFFQDFAAGKKSISVDKCDAVLEWFRENWPDDAKWPPVRPLMMGRNPQSL